jgi:membrane protein DedA with SNARE-associated domain
VPDLSDFWPFFAAFAMLVAAGIGVPIPEEIPTIGAGIWVGTSPEFGPARWLILPVCFLGVLISDVLLYGLGRLWGPRLLDHRWVTRFITPETRQRTEQNFHSYGVKALLLVRWVPGIRSPMFITAGLMRLPLPLFVLADGIAAVFGHSLLFFLAYWFGDQFLELVQRAEHTVSTTLKPLLILTAIGAVAIYLLVHVYRRPVITGDPKEVPLIGDKVADKLSYPEIQIPSSPAASPPATSPSRTSDAASQSPGGR